MFKAIILLAVLAVLASVASAQYYYGGYGAYAPAYTSYGYGYPASYGYAAYPGAYYLKK